MASEITKQDLRDLKIELISEIKTLIQPQMVGLPVWLRSKEVRKLLNISAGTLQTLRVNGTLSYSRIGTLFYYKKADIFKILESRNK